MIRLTIEKGFQWEELESDVLVLMSFDVYKRWLERRGLQGGEDSVSQVPVRLECVIWKRCCVLDRLLESGNESFIVADEFFIFQEGWAAQYVVR
jgi:hypothetical protein